PDSPPGHRTGSRPRAEAEGGPGESGGFEKKAPRSRGSPRDVSMKAWISGQAAVAVLADGENLFSVDLDRPEVLVPRQAGDIPHLFADAGDVVEREVASRGQAVEELERSWRKDSAIRLALIFRDAAAGPGPRA